MSQLEIIDDLEAEHASLDTVVADLSEEQWRATTPADGWDVADSVSHLYYFDGRALLALTDAKGFEKHLHDLMSQGLSEADVKPGRQLGAGLLEPWRTSRRALIAAMRACDPKERILWYGPAMSLRSFVTARLMETWAHGVDVTDALGLPVLQSERLKDVCHISIGARAYSFLSHEQVDPGDPIRCELVSPAGQTWTWGPEDASNVVTGVAVDLALLVTQRRHRDDTQLVVKGSTAEAWLAVAQSFAGPSGGGRKPL